MPSVRERRILLMCARVHLSLPEQSASLADSGRAPTTSVRSAASCKTVRRCEPQDMERTQVHHHSTGRARGPGDVGDGRRSHHRVDARVGILPLSSHRRDDGRTR